MICPANDEKAAFGGGSLPAALADVWVAKRVYCHIFTHTGVPRQHADTGRMGLQPSLWGRRGAKQCRLVLCWRRSWGWVLVMLGDYVTGPRQAGAHIRAAKDGEFVVIVFIVVFLSSLSSSSFFLLWLWVSGL